MRPTHAVTRATFLLVCILFAMLGVLPVGCARTSLRTPDGLEYLGEKNVSAELIRVKKFYPDGKPMLDVEIKGLTSDPTAVNQGTVQAILGTTGAALGTVNSAIGKIPDARGTDR